MTRTCVFPNRDIQHPLSSRLSGRSHYSWMRGSLCSVNGVIALSEFDYDGQVHIREFPRVYARVRA